VQPAKRLTACALRLCSAAVQSRSSAG